MPIDPGASFKTATEAAKKLKLGVLDLLPAFAALAKGEGLFKASVETIKFTALLALIPISGQIGLGLLGISKGIKSIVKDTGSLEAAIRRLDEIKGLEKVFAPLLGGVAAAKDRVAELLKVFSSSKFDLKGIAEASKSLQLLTGGLYATRDGLKTVEKAADATGNPIQDVAGEVGLLYSQLKRGADISSAAESLRSMGVISEHTASQIVNLQQSGAGLSTIFGKVDADLRNTAEQASSTSETLGELQAKYDKIKASLQEAVGAPFIDAEKEGIKDSIKVAENLRPALTAVAKNFAAVSGAVGHAKNGFLVFITSIPNLAGILSGVTKAIIATTGALLAVGAGKAVANIGTLAKAFQSLRVSTGVDDLGKSLLSKAGRYSEAAELLTRSSNKLKAAGSLELSASRAASAVSAGRKATALRTGAVATLDSGAIGAAASSAGAKGLQLLASAGRALLNPLFLIPAAVVAVVGVIQSLRETHAQAAKAVADLTKANHETIKGLDEQISRVTTVDEKYRALTSTTNALIDAQTRLSDLKLPSADNQLTGAQKIKNYFTQGSGIVRGVNSALGNDPIEKESTTASRQRRVELEHIKELESRKRGLQATPDISLVGEKDLERARRAVALAKELEDAKAQAALESAPNAANREAVNAANRIRLEAKARSGEAEQNAGAATENRAGEIGDQLREQQAKRDSASGHLETLAGTNDRIQKSNEAARKEVEAIQANGKTREQAQLEVNKRRAASLQGTIDQEGKSQTIGLNKAGVPIVAEGKKATEAQKEELGAVNEQIKAQEQINQKKQDLAALRRSSGAELQQLNQAKTDLQEGKTATVGGKTVARSKEAIIAIEKRIAELQDLVASIPQNQQGAQQAGLAEQVEGRKKRTEAPDIAAEKAILAIKTEGLDREEEISNIQAKRNADELAAIKENNDAENKDRPKTAQVTFESRPDVAAINQQETERKRSDTQRNNRREDIGFSAKALDISATTGKGPQEEIKALEKQLALSKEITKAIQAREGISEEDRNSELAEQLNQRVSILKTLSDTKSEQEQTLRSAQAQTDALSAQAKGQTHLASLIQIRAAAEERVVSALRAGNRELAQQALNQGKGSIIEAQAKENIRVRELRRTSGGQRQLEEERTDQRHLAEEIKRVENNPGASASEQLKILQDRAEAQKTSEEKLSDAVVKAAMEARDAQLEAAEALTNSAKAITSAVETSGGVTTATTTSGAATGAPGAPQGGPVVENPTQQSEAAKEITRILETQTQPAKEDYENPNREIETSKIPYAKEIYAAAAKVQGVNPEEVPMPEKIGIFGTKGKPTTFGEVGAIGGAPGNTIKGGYNMATDKFRLHADQVAGLQESTPGSVDALGHEFGHYTQAKKYGVGPNQGPLDKLTTDEKFAEEQSAIQALGQGGGVTSDIWKAKKQTPMNVVKYATEYGAEASGRAAQEAVAAIKAPAPPVATPSVTEPIPTVKPMVVTGSPVPEQLAQPPPPKARTLDQVYETNPAAHSVNPAAYGFRSTIRNQDGTPPPRGDAPGSGLRSSGLSSSGLGGPGLEELGVHIPDRSFAARSPLQYAHVRGAALDQASSGKVEDRVSSGKVAPGTDGQETPTGRTALDQGAHSYRSTKREAVGPAQLAKPGGGVEALSKLAGELKAALDSSSTLTKIEKNTQGVGKNK